MIHPMTLHFICLLGLSVSADPQFKLLRGFNTKTPLDPVEFTVKHVSRAFASQRKTILYYIEDWYLYDNWSYPMVCLGLFPVWLQLWYCSLCKVHGL